MMLTVAFAVSMGLAGCGRKKSADAHSLKVGIESGPEYQMALAAQKVAKERYQLDVELVQFNDYVMPNAALQQGDIDVNVFQNRPYLEVQSKNRGYKFAVLGDTFVYPLAGYSKQLKHLNQLQNGSTVVIPNDPTNSGRALLLMQKAGLLKLRGGVGLLPTVNDITNNPQKLNILQLEAPQLPRALDDPHVAIAIINSNFATSAGFIASRDGLFMEDKQSPYVNIIVSREENKGQKKVQEFVKSYQSPEVAKAAEMAFKGGAIKGW